MKDPQAPLKANGARLWNTVEASADIGVGRPGGLARVALNDDDRRMRDQFVRWCEQAGCTVTVDGMGNIFARRAGRDDSLAPVLLGATWTPRSMADATTASSGCWPRSRRCAR
ncbi:MAG: hypothetical protein R3E68_11650 [Burkholderiaceae bacterium]